ncbi:hsp70-like protein [Phyllosticta citrichinensis]|uniref:Hsp70-like protein n=1 Tax=Phyllosticta citrichinensis TaxID=1130410 RepID=A0ABR1XME7_9PEZI
MMDTDHKIVLGLDFGTTYTGVAYGSTAGDAQDLEIITNWPDSSGASYKTPTKIAYHDENIDEDGGEDKWGFQVNARLNSYTWFKLLLNTDLDPNKYDDKPHDSNSQGILRLPQDHSAQDVCRDYLKLVWEFIKDVLEQRFTDDSLNLPVEVWMTVPAIWTETAKDQTRAAAKAAGFASGPNDCIKLITEPEAAAVAILHPTLRGAAVDPIREGEAFVVCDCGGGTVDLTTYKFESCSPNFKFKEICMGEGARCGSTFVDRNFDAWMAKRFKGNYTKLSAKSRGPGSKMMESFEKAKSKFGPKLMDQETERVKIENVDMNVQGSELYDREDHTVLFPWAVMKTFFDPVIDRVLELLESQVRKSKRRGCEVGRVMLAGGFGDSPYLRYRLKTWCRSQKCEIKLLCPPKCQAAIMAGAVIRGLIGLKPIIRIARCHYGFSWSEPFRDGIDLEEDAWYDQETGAKMAYHRMKWVVKKGQQLKNNFSMKQEIERQILPGEVRSKDRLQFFSCSAEARPDFEYSENVKLVGQVKISFTEEDWENARPVISEKKERIWYLGYDVLINVNADEGILIVNVCNQRRQMGNAEIEFNQEE